MHCALTTWAVGRGGDSVGRGGDSRRDGHQPQRFLTLLAFTYGMLQSCPRNGKLHKLATRCTQSRRACEAAVACERAFDRRAGENPKMRVCDARR